MFTKVIVVVDHDVKYTIISEGLENAVCVGSGSGTCSFSLGPMDTLDHAARMQDFGSKMGIDATRKWPSEGLHDLGRMRY